jgi:hypothetical protein
LSSQPGKVSRRKLKGCGLLLAAITCVCAAMPERLLAQTASRPGPVLGTAGRSVPGLKPSTSTNTAQAVLHITATVVPVALVPQSSPENSNALRRSVYVPERPLDLEVISQSHPLQATPNAVLKTITVVPR